MTDTGRTLRLSWSRLRLHEECPAKGRLISEGHKSPITDIRNFFPGTVADRCMRQWLASDEPQRGWMAAQVDSIMDAEEEKARQSGDGVVKWKHSTDREEVRALCKQAVYQLEQDLWTQLHLWQPPAYDWDPAPRFEVPITIPHPAGHKEKIYLVGEIDLLVRRPFDERNHYDMYQFHGKERPETVIEVWDLKTTRDNQYWRKTLGQLVFYEIAVWGMTRQWPVVSGLLQPLCDETTPMWQFSMDHRTQMLQRIVATASDIWTGRLDPKPEKHLCGHCEVRHSCPLKGGGRGRVAMAMPVPGT